MWIAPNLKSILEMIKQTIIVASTFTLLNHSLSIESVQELQIIIIIIIII